MTLRRPFFFAAVALIALCVLVELGIGSLLKDAQAVQSEVAKSIEAANVQGVSETDRAQALAEVDVEGKSRPGLGIRYLALLDGIVLITVGLMLTGLYFPESIHARVQAVAFLLRLLLPDSAWRSC